ncbi:hypothetical protein [Chryseobacterium shigense]|uniref:Uncharacterized protein n=1 Tax=Chryseobacterium shigense TaxID=297244 RepID=A0A841NB85_9FLAO|nr:hypothetical protein [Chryseobacterium shigense]MBB6369272.1 hypothetical protein [Chryseobacterium shigense]
MKKVSFVCLSLLMLASCKNKSEKTVNEALIIKKDSIPTKKAVTANTSSNAKKTSASKECTEKQIEYETEQICTFKNADIDEVYQRTIKDKEIEQSELLLTDLPKENITKEINKNGLISIDYTVSPQKTVIEFLFAGGVTTLSLEQTDKDVKRIIIHSAD